MKSKNQLRRRFVYLFAQVPLMNGQVGPSVRPQMSQTSMARHPSREQLIDYLMLKVSQQPHGPPRLPHDTLQQEVSADVYIFFIFTLLGFKFISSKCLSVSILGRNNNIIPGQLNR